MHKKTVCTIHIEMPKPYIWHRDSAKLMVTKKDGNPKV